MIGSGDIHFRKEYGLVGKNKGAQINWPIFLGTDKDTQVDWVFFSGKNEGTQIGWAIFLGKNKRTRIDWAIFLGEIEGTQINLAIFLGKDKGTQIGCAIFLEKNMGMQIDFPLSRLGLFFLDKQTHISREGFRNHTILYVICQRRWLVVLGWGAGLGGGIGEWRGGIGWKTIVVYLAIQLSRFK